MKVGDYPTWDLSKTTKLLHLETSQKKKDAINYRDVVYESAITGEMACRHPKKWVEEFDDSMENYVQQMKLANS